MYVDLLLGRSAFSAGVSASLSLDDGGLNYSVEGIELVILYTSSFK